MNALFSQFRLAILVETLAEKVDFVKKSLRFLKLVAFYLPDADTLRTAFLHDAS